MPEFEIKTAEERVLERWPTEQLGHLSASSLKMASRCWNQWRLRYVKGQKQRPGKNLAWGRADHGAIEDSIAQRINEGQHLTVKEIGERFAHHIEEYIDEAGGVTEVEWVKDKTSTKNDAIAARDEVIEKGAALAGLYRTEVAPHFEPESVEKRFEIPVPGLPVPMFGFIDLVGRPVLKPDDKAPKLGPPRMVDRKTSGQSRSAPKPEWMLQGRVYQLVEPLELDFHVSVKTKAPKVMWGTEGLTLPVADVAETQRIIRQMAAMAVTLMERYGPDEAWPGAWANDWACNYCGYRTAGLCAWMSP